MGCSNKAIRVQRKNLTNIVLIAVFVGFIAVFFLLFCILPKAEGELSPNERRVLADAPTLDFESVFSGDFSADVDVWLEDHFPARSFFVLLYSYVNRFTGRNATESIILGSHDRLYTAPTEMNEAQIMTNGNTIGGFIEANDMNGYMAIIPSAGYMAAADLPATHLAYEDGEIIRFFNQETLLNEASEMVDIAALFSTQTDIEGLYYRTDHHLTMQGSYLVYTAIARQLGFTPLPETEFTKTGYSFYGTSYGSSGLLLTPPDCLETWVRAGDERMIVTILDGTTETVHSGMLDMNQLGEDVVDKYAAYLYSNHAYTSVVNPDVEDGILMVVKDSYGNAIVPFLTAHYHEIIMIDVRYYGLSMKYPSEIATRLGITDIALICGVDTIVESNDFVRLR